MLAAMIKYRVQHNPNSSFVTTLHQGFQQSIVAEVRINLLVIHNIVFMIGGRRKQRGQVKRRDA
ncbi:hypothetical protein D3C81_865160 [compost metagenome]